MPAHESGLGSEHRFCDTVQLIMLILFFVAWIADNILHYTLNVSSIIFDFTIFPFLILPAILVSGFGVFLVSKSNSLVFGKHALKSKIIDCGVYSWVRHPMYLGALMFILGFLVVSLSIISLAIWFLFFYMYDKMTEYEENDLIRILGDEYIEYKKRVSKWIPKLKK